MSADYQPDLIELENKTDRDLLVICVSKLNAMENKTLPSMDKHLEKINGLVAEHSDRLTATETKCRETTKTVFSRLDRWHNGEGGRPPKKYVAAGVTVIVVLGSLGYAAGRVMGWW